MRPAHEPPPSRRRLPVSTSTLGQWALYGGTLAVVMFLAVAVDWARLQDKMFRTDLVLDQFPRIVTQAAKNTLIFTAFGFAGGLALGVVLALMRLSTFRPYRWFAAVYIDVIRGLPALLVLIFIAFGLPIALDIRIPGTYGRGSVALAIVSSAYIAEVVRAGIEAVPKGQTEAARSLGMSHGQAMRRIVIPQAFRIIIPPMTNELVLLLKDTALISVIGVTEATKELTRFGRDGVNANANATPLVVAGLVYLALTLPMTRLAGYLERRARASR
ncbi:MAG: ABC transporter permease [Chloroflexi bacterium HGW-Chloroflexi-9]|nr:MAG: ABC transporter permease [Chloroflexi bacterium HGW-Chloroflexi-9]